MLHLRPGAEARTPSEVGALGGHGALALTGRDVSALGREDAADKKVINNLPNLSINRICTQANLRSPEHCFFFFF